MGTEIIAITFANLCILGYSLLIRVFRLAMVKFGFSRPELGTIYKYHAVFVLLLALLPSISFLWAISSDYGFAVGYILIIQTPIMLLTLWAIMSFGAWKNLTS
jgi:hypothetical protein